MLGFNLWGLGVVPRKCTPRKTGTVLEPCLQPCWNLPGTLLATLLEPCCNPGSPQLGSWNGGTPNLASWNVRALLPCLETESPVSNFEPCTLRSCRVDAFLWIILLTPCSLNKLKQLYCVLRLLCIALVISLLMNQTQTKTLTSLEPWCLEPWTLETWNPRTLVI